MCATTPPAIDPQTLDFIFSYTKDAPAKQLQDADALDGKVVQTLAAASVILGFVGLSSGVRSGGHWAIGLLAAALLAYSVVALLALLQLRPKTFRQSLVVDQLWSEHWFEDVATIKHDLVQDVVEANQHNKHLLNAKARNVRWALRILAVETVLVALAVLVTRII